MAKLMILDKPLCNSPKTFEFPAGAFLVEELLKLYPNGFPTTVKIYRDIPSDKNEIELTSDGIPLKENDVYWLAFYPQGIEVLIISFVATLIIGKVIANAIEAAIPELTTEDFDSSTAGVGSSSNNQLRGQRNQIRLGEKISQIYGQVRSFPDLIDDPVSSYIHGSNQELSDFEPAGGLNGDQILIQQFVPSQGNVDYSLARIGNQSLSLTDTLNIIDTVVGPVLTNTRGEVSERIELIPEYENGDIVFVSLTDVPPNFLIDMVILVSGSNVTFTIRQNYAAATSAPIDIFNRLAKSVNIGDAFQFRSATAGISGTFDIESWEMEALSTIQQLVITGTSQSGFISATYDDGNSFLMYSAQGFRGNKTSNSSSIADLTFSSNPQPEHFFPMARKELSNREPSASEVLRVVISAPNGMRITALETSGKVTIVSEVWEANDSGLRIGASAINTNSQDFSPIQGQTFSTSVEVTDALAQPGRRLGILLKVSQAFEGKSFSQNQELIQGAIQVAGLKRLYLNQSSQSGKIVDVTIISDLLQLVRKTNSGSVRSSSDKFNVLADRKIPIFNSGTGLFGATAFTQDFADIFMHHAVNVGSILISEINFDELYVIQDAINLADPEDGFFSYTFANKNTALDQELATICSVARVILYKEGSLYRFVRDEAKSKVGNVTSRAMIDPGSKGISFSMPNPHDGVLLEYIDPTTDKLATITAPDSPVPVRPKKIRTAGIRNFDQAWRRAQYEYLKLFSQRITRTITASRESLLWDLRSRITVYDHTREKIIPLAASDSAFRQETELQLIDISDVFYGTERISTDNQMAMELFFDHTGDGTIQNILINVDPDDARNFTIDASVPTITKDLIIDNARQVSDSNQIGEKIFIYPVAITANQLTQDDYLIISKRPAGEDVELELIRYNESLYQFDGVSPP